MTQQLDKNNRSLSGERVVAQCEFFSPALNRLVTEKAQAPHPIVFNMRGGCIYIQQYLDASHLEALFPHQRLGKLSQLSIFDNDANHFIFSDIKLRLVRLKPSLDAIGVVFRFVNLNPTQMDLLQQAHSALPAMRSAETAIQLSDNLYHWRMAQLSQGQPYRLAS